MDRGLLLSTVGRRVTGKLRQPLQRVKLLAKFGRDGRVLGKLRMTKPISKESELLTI